MAEKKKRIEHEVAPVGDDLANSLAETLNANNKDNGKVAFFLSDSEDPSKITDWISTGEHQLDIAISNRPNGGLPAGRITELTGLEASGKSLVAAHLLADTQKKGGVAVFIDTEYAVSPEFLTAIGVDVSKMLYINVNTVEDIFDNIEAIVAKVRQSNKNRLVTIVVDSMAAASTKKEMASDHGADGYATGKAIAISKAMRKITELVARQRICLVFTNQLRQKIGFVGFGDPWTTSGGKALAFHASVRIRLKSTGGIKVGDTPIGIKTKAVVIKNRMGPPLRGCEFNIFFDRGIDSYGSWLETLIENKVVTNAKKVKEDKTAKKTKKQLEEDVETDKKAKSLQILLPKGEGVEPEQVLFEKKDFPTLLNSREDVREYLYNQLCEVCIMKYKSPNSTLEDDVEVDAGQEGLDE
jgi:recombination protein RecA